MNHEHNEWAGHGLYGTLLEGDPRLKHSERLAGFLRWVTMLFAGKEGSCMRIEDIEKLGYSVRTVSNSISRPNTSRRAVKYNQHRRVGKNFRHPFRLVCGSFQLRCRIQSGFQNTDSHSRGHHRYYVCVSSSGCNIILASGFKVPPIVRRDPGTATYRVISPAYIYGMMMGRCGRGMSRSLRTLCLV
jgi:hypothetical protein